MMTHIPPTMKAYLANAVRLFRPRAPVSEPDPGVPPEYRLVIDLRSSLTFQALQDGRIAVVQINILHPAGARAMASGLRTMGKAGEKEFPS